MDVSRARCKLAPSVAAGGWEGWVSRKRGSSALTWLNQVVKAPECADNERAEREREEARPTQHTTRRGAMRASGKGEKREEELLDERMRAGNSGKQITETDSDASPPPGPLVTALC